MNSDEFRSFLKKSLPSMGYRWQRFDRRNIKRRVRFRMESLRLFELEQYAQLVHRDATERTMLDSLLRLTITRFFRNQELWLELAVLMKQTGKSLGMEEALSVWSAGCSGGEEAFSMAMLLDDLARSGHLSHSWIILGTDTDPASLKRARETAYKWGSVREIPRHLMDRWFTEDGDLWAMDKRIRHLVTFRQHDIVVMAPPGRFHLVFLRNSILTYNTEEVQRKVLERIRQCLLDPGYLVIGRTETMPEGVGFDQVSRCIYRMT